MSLNNNTFNCAYGHHQAEKEDFSESGLNNKYTICKKCNSEKMKKYREKHGTKYNEQVKEYQKEYMRKWRMEKMNKMNKEILIS